MIGARTPWYAKYKVGFEKTGKINSVVVELYCDSGNAFLDGFITLTFAPTHMDNVYNIPNWRIIPKLCKTSTPANTTIRCPGSKRI